MATKQIKRTATAADDIAGLKSSRYEKLQVSYGTVPANTISVGDVLSFSDVPSQDIIRATVVVHESTAKMLTILPGTNTAAQQEIVITQAGSGLVTSQISYVIEYVRGTGKVGVSASSAAALLNNADEDGASVELKVASGDCLQVKIKK
jgi:hypothetical protein